MTERTRVLAVNVATPDSTEFAEAIAEAAAVLEAGGLVAFPTETVYGLGALALNDEAVKGIFKAKGRPAWNPLIVHVWSADEARALCAEWNANAEKLARAFWPGALTLVVPRAEHVPAVVAAGGPTVALRAPSHPVARALVAAAGPIAAPSANRYQSLSPTTAEHVLRTLDGAVGLVIDGGACTEGIESTVVDVTEAVPRILRPGVVSVDAIRAVVGDVVAEAKDADAFVADNQARRAPGMVARHYAPRARLRIIDGRDAAIAVADELASRGGKVGFVACGGSYAELEDVNAAVTVLENSPSAYARHLFATLHQFDGDGMTDIVVEGVPAGEDWWGIRDRLARGAVQNG